MSERALLCRDWEVRALAAGRKTQVRRPVKFKRPFEDHSSWRAVYPAPTGGFIFFDYPLPGDAEQVRQQVDRMLDGREGRVSPLGVPGDLLYVRERFSWLTYDPGLGLPPFWYWADGNPKRGDWTRPDSAALMPKVAARLWLRVTDVRVQRVQDISEADARAEGFGGEIAAGPGWDEQAHDFFSAEDYARFDAVRRFRLAWNVAHGPESWDASLWVWATTIEPCAAPAREGSDA